MRGFEDPAGSRQVQWFLDRPLELGFRQPPSLPDLAKDPLLAFDRLLEVRMWIQARRGLRQSGQQGALRRTEVTQRLGKIKVRSGSAAAVEIAVVQASQVRGENPLLVPELFEPQSLHGLD